MRCVPCIGHVRSNCSKIKAGGQVVWLRTRNECAQQTDLWEQQDNMGQRTDVLHINSLTRQRDVVDARGGSPRSNQRSSLAAVTTNKGVAAASMMPVARRVSKARSSGGGRRDKGGPRKHTGVKCSTPCDKC